MNVFGPRPISVHDRPQFLRDRYARVVLISDASHLADLSPDDSDALVVTTDWLIWRQWIERGGHALHWESALTDWPQPGGPADDHLMAGARWMWIDGADVTRFLGVSLGRQFYWESSASWHAAFRLNHALDRLVGEFRPAEIVLRGLRTEYDFLPAASATILAQAIADKHGAVFREETRAGPPVNLHPQKHFAAENGAVPKWRNLVRSAYSRLVDLASRGMDLARRRPRVLIVQNPLIVKALLSEMPAGGVRPVLLAAHFSKTPSFVISNLRKGVFFAHLPNCGLTATDRATLSAIRQRLEAHWTQKASPMEEAHRAFLRQYVLTPQAFEQIALRTKQFSALFRSVRPDRVLVGDAENSICRMVLELAARDGAGSDELPNGIFLSRQHLDARISDCGRPPAISRYLASGEWSERWLALQDAGIDIVRTGYPVADYLLSKEAPPLPGCKHALLLPLHIDRTDVRGLEADVFSTMVAAASALIAKGWTVRVKVHPGFHEAGYYQAVLDAHGCAAEAIKDGTLPDHIAWADLVVGPINSNAVIETLANKRPYVAMRTRPSSLEPTIWDPLPVVDTISGMLAQVELGGLDPAIALKLLADYDAERPAAGRIWAAMAGALE